ncbi:MAG TPA: 2-oxoglutarate dehydrogenase E1 component, partial [Dongiaceae bacterium]|nr:2-oxoglutarate dehydrogenase E1 component [Dongiaceae bacterium]
MRDQERESSFLSGSNATFIVELYARYAKDPQSVEPGWRSYFAGLGDEAAEALADLRGASWAPPRPEIMTPESKTNGSLAPGARRGTNGALLEKPAPAPEGAGLEALRAAATDSIRALQL